MTSARASDFSITCSSWWHAMAGSTSTSAPTAISMSISTTRWRISVSHWVRRSPRRSAHAVASTGPATSSCPWTRRSAVAAIDLGGRPHAVVDLALKVERVGDLQSELVTDFFEGFALGARGNVHVKVMYGRSSHHHVEAVFKAFGRALRVACSRDKQLARTLPSTKGLL